MKQKCPHSTQQLVTNNNSARHSIKECFDGPARRAVNTPTCSLRCFPTVFYENYVCTFSYTPRGFYSVRRTRFSSRLFRRPSKLNQTCDIQAPSIVSACVSRNHNRHMCNWYSVWGSDRARRRVRFKPTPQLYSPSQSLVYLSTERFITRKSTCTPLLATISRRTEGSET